MVTVFELNPEVYLENGILKIDDWLQANFQYRNSKDSQLLSEVLEFIIGSSRFVDCLQVTKILIELGLDLNSIISGTLFLVYENNYEVQNYVSNTLSTEIHSLLQGLLRIEQLHIAHPVNVSTLEFSKHNVENLRKLLLATVSDVRVIIIKLAIHTYRMRAATKASVLIQEKLARESIEIYGPLANRLGIGQIKWELEDYSLRYTQPNIYRQIVRWLDEKRLDREKYLNDVKFILHHNIIKHDIPCKIHGRVKHIYSIWRKMQSKGLNYNQIYDVRAVRIIVNSVAECYAVLGVTHSLWKNIPGEFDDYIANPKTNGYQSLHTAVIGPEGKVLEVQIRTQAQHDVSELGVAAHWLYKEGAKAEKNDFEAKLADIRKILQDPSDIVIDGDSVEALRAEFFNDRIYVFTPKGDVIDLPKGATPIDYAYHIHTELGHRCRGAKANGKMLNLSQPIPNGSQVEILTGKYQSPSRDWLNHNLHYVVTHKARSKISSWFKQLDREKNIDGGREMLFKELKRLGYENVNIKDLIHNIANCNNEDDLYIGFSYGDIKISQIMGALASILPLKLQQSQQAKTIDPSLLKISHKQVAINKSSGILVEGVGGLATVIAKCCNPIPGDEVIGYITLGDGVTIHRLDCTNILNLQDNKKHRLIKIEWGNGAKDEYLASINIEAFNRISLLKDISSVFSSIKMNILGINSRLHEDTQVVTIKITVAVQNLETLYNSLSKIQAIPNVLEVYRLHEN